MDRHLFAKKRVSLAVSVALGAVAAAPVAAQQSENANDQVMEEVVVTGIRSSLKRAMDTKRDATGVVDAINGVTDTKLTSTTQRLLLDPDDGTDLLNKLCSLNKNYNICDKKGKA